jgi:nucleoside-triphosphatase
MQEKGLVVIDEIGPMELLSEAFRQVVMDILESEADVLGSIVRRSIPFSDEIKKRPGVRVIEIHPGNREAVVGEIAAILGGEGHD